MIVIADIFGYAGTVVGASLMLPQVYDSYKRKSMDDVSFVMLMMYLLNCVLWNIYGVLIWSIPLIIANTIAGIIGITLIIMKIFYSKNNNSSDNNKQNKPKKITRKIISKKRITTKTKTRS